MAVAKCHWCTAERKLDQSWDGQKAFWAAVLDTLIAHSQREEQIWRPGTGPSYKTGRSVKKMEF